MESKNQNAVPGQLLATLATGVSDQELDRSMQAVGGRIIQKIVGLGMTTALIEVNPAEAAKALERLQNDANFTAVQYNGVVHL